MEPILARASRRKASLSSRSGMTVEVDPLRCTTLDVDRSTELKSGLVSPEPRSPPASTDQPRAAVTASMILWISVMIEAITGGNDRRTTPLVAMTTSSFAGRPIRKMFA